MNYAQVRGTPYFAGTTHTTLAIATQIAVVGLRNYVTDIAGSTDKIGNTISIVDAATKGTLFAIVLNASTPFAIGFNTPIMGSVTSTVTVVVGGSASCSAYIGGFTL